MIDHPVESVQAISMLHNQQLYDRRMTVRLDRANEPDMPPKLPEGTYLFYSHSYYSFMRYKETELTLNLENRSERNWNGTWSWWQQISGCSQKHS